MGSRVLRIRSSPLLHALHDEIQRQIPHRQDNLFSIAAGIAWVEVQHQVNAAFFVYSQHLLQYSLAGVGTPRQERSPPQKIGEMPGAYSR